MYHQEDQSVARVQPSSLGRLSVLPAEVRLQIWQHFKLLNRVRSYATKSGRSSHLPCGNRLAILRTNRAICQEVCAELYMDQAICFSVYGEGNPRDFQCVVKDPPETEAKDFKTADFSKFKSIKIEIHAPEERDPGQILLLRIRLMSLLSVLTGVDCNIYGSRTPDHELSSLQTTERLLSSLQRTASMFPRIDIEFINHTSGYWHRDGTLQRSIPYYPDHDLKYVLNLFKILRNAPQVSFSLRSESHALTPFPDTISRDLRSHTRLSPLFGARHEDRILLAREASRTVDLDMALDTLPGQTADVLRCVRFQNWNHYRPRLVALNELSAIVTNEWEIRAARQALKARYKTYRSFGQLFTVAAKSQGGTTAERNRTADDPGGRGTRTGLGTMDPYHSPRYCELWLQRCRSVIPADGSREWHWHMDDFEWRGLGRRRREERGMGLLLGYWDRKSERG